MPCGPLNLSPLIMNYNHYCYSAIKYLSVSSHNDFLTFSFEIKGDRSYVFIQCTNAISVVMGKTKCF